MATTFSLDRFSRADAFTISKEVAKGLPAKAIRDLVSDSAISLADVARIVAPRRTLNRRLNENTRLTPDESDRFARMMRVLSLATHVFGDRSKAMQWLDSPKKRFEGMAPFDLLRSDAGARLVEEVLEQSRHGFHA